MAIGHSKVWESLLVAGGIVFAFGIIWGSFLAVQRFEEAEGAIVLIVMGVIMLLVSESVLTAMKVKKR